METTTQQYDMDLMTIDLKKYFFLLWHWAWLIILAALLAGVSAYLVSRSLQPTYEAETTVLVDEGASSAGSEYQSILMSERLTQTYADLITQRPILEAVVGKLELDVELDEFQESITVSPLRDTQLISILVEDHSPVQAAQIANTLVEVFIEQNAERQASRYTSTKTSLLSQMNEIENDIQDLEGQLEELEDDKDNASERGQLELTLSQYRSTYSGLLQSYEELLLAEAEAVSSIVQVEPASFPEEPVRPRTLVNTALAVVVGGMLAVGGVFLVDALDNTISDPEELKRTQGLNLLGMIPQHEPEDGDIITVAEPRHPVSEAYRALRTNLKYTSVDNPVRVIMITSSEPSVGKTSVVSNLAVVFAQAGSRVVLVDCDLRKPKIHHRLNNSNHLGLSEYFLDEKITLKDLVEPFPEVDNLSLITAGKLPPNPAELLGSERMAKLLAALEKEYDYILLDSPPLLAVTDAAVLSKQTDGTLLVVKPGQTKIDALTVAVEQLGYVQANILGLVMNEIPRRKSRYYHQGYQYYTYQDYSPGEE